MNVALVLKSVSNQAKKPICIRFTENRKSNYINLGFYSKSKNFSDVSPNVSLAINEKLLSAKEIIERMKIERISGFQNFKHLFNAPQKTDSLKKIIDRIVYDLKESGKYGNAEVYKLLCSTLEKYKPNSKINDVNKDFLIGLERYLILRKCSGNTIFNYMRTLKAVINRSISSGIDLKYPFRNNMNKNGFDISRFKTETRKRALSNEQIEKLKNYKGNYQFAVDVFLISYYSYGCSFVDLAKWKESNINGSTLQYKRQKTGQLITVEICPELQVLIDKYKHQNKPFLMPILNVNYLSGVSVHNRVKKALKLVNEQLKKIAIDLDLPSDLTTYYARHSFASVLHHKDVNIGIISQALGHTDLKTTQVYLQSFSSKKVSEIINHVL